MAMHCTHYIISTKLWYWGAQNQTQDSSCQLSTADTRGRIDLLMTVLLMPPWMLLPLCHNGALLPNVQLGVSVTSWWFFTKLFPVSQYPICAGMLGLRLPRCRIGHFPLLNLKRFLSPRSSSLSRCLWEAADPPTASSTSPRYLLCPSLAEGTLCPTAQIIDEDVKQFCPESSPVLITSD